MADPINRHQLLDDIRRGHVPKPFYQLFCDHCSRSAGTLSHFAETLAVPISASLGRLIRRATAPLSWTDLQRAVEKMPVGDRERFAAEILGPAPAAPDGG